MYKLIKCKNCKTFNITNAKIVTKCKYCNKNINLKNIKIYFQNENPNILTKTLQTIKEEEFKNDIKLEGQDDFFNYEVN